MSDCDLSAPHPSLSTRELTTAVARGEPQSLRVFYEAWFERAQRLARALTRRDEDFCLDIVQDAFLRAIRAMRPLESEADLERWLLRVVTTTALDALRRESRRLRREARAGAARYSEAAAAARPAEMALEIAEQVEWLTASLACLEEGERELLRQRYLAEKTLAEAGAPLGLSPFAVHGRLRRILERLRAAARDMFAFGILS